LAFGTACMLGLYFSDFPFSSFLPYGPSTIPENGAVLRAFEESSTRLERLRYESDGGLPAIDFLDALDQLRPAFSAMGIIFEVSTKEITSNIAKLREVHADSMVTTSVTNFDTNSMQRLILAGHPHPRFSQPDRQMSGEDAELFDHGMQNGSDVARSAAEAAPTPMFPWEKGHRWPWDQKRSRRLANGSLSKVTYPPMEGFEAGRWLGFGLHFMELCYECLGKGKSPGVCASHAYESALKPHQNVAMRAIARSFLRIVPMSQAHILQASGLDESSFTSMMTRWATAVHRHRRTIEDFYSYWPPHTA